MTVRSPRAIRSSGFDRINPIDGSSLMKTACLDEQGKAVEVEVERVALKIELSSWLPGGCAATTANHDKFLE